MDIAFKTRKLAKTFNSDKELKKVYGQENSRKIKLRMTVLHAAAHLGEVPAEKPIRCHALHGQRKGQFAVDLKHPFRLVFSPNHDPLPETADGNIDLSQVTCLKILSVEDYH